MKLTVIHNFPDFVRRVSDIQKRQIPFATVLALNETAFEVKREIERSMPQYLDRPTRWTLRSVRYTKAEKTKLWSEVWFDPWGNKRGITADKWLGPLIFGAARKRKGFENKLALQRILGPNEYVVPGSAAPRDAYGNVPGSFIVRLLSRLRASHDVAGFMANETAASRKRRLRRKNQRQVEYFVARPGSHLPRGIWERTGFGSAVRPVFLFVKGAPRYKKQFPFFEIAQRVKRREFPRRFEAAFRRALATAR